jgi:hypothetical protein
VTSQVLVSLRVKASATRAFEVFTRDIALWWSPNILFQFTPRSPGTLAFEPHEGGRFTETLANGSVFEIGRIRVWEPGERLVFGWRQATFRPGQDTYCPVHYSCSADAQGIGQGARLNENKKGCLHLQTPLFVYSFRAGSISARMVAREGGAAVPSTDPSAKWMWCGA